MLDSLIDHQFGYACSLDASPAPGIEAYCYTVSIFINPIAIANEVILFPLLMRCQHHGLINDALSTYRWQYDHRIFLAYPIVQVRSDRRFIRRGA